MSKPRKPRKPKHGTVPARIIEPINKAGVPRGGGRPTLCHPTTYDPLLNLLRVGLYIEQACSHVGIAKETLYEWLRRARDGEEPFATFAEAYEKAQSHAELTALMQIREGVLNWQSRAWFLERRFRDRWGRTDKLELTGNGPERVTAAAARAIMSEVFPGDVTPSDLAGGKDDVDGS